MAPHEIKQFIYYSVNSLQRSQAVGAEQGSAQGGRSLSPRLHLSLHISPHTLQYLSEDFTSQSAPATQLRITALQKWELVKAQQIAMSVGWWAPTDWRSSVLWSKALNWSSYCEPSRLKATECQQSGLYWITYSVEQGLETRSPLSKAMFCVHSLA